MKKRRPRRRPIERFWAKVNQAGPVPQHAPLLGPCWLWTGAVAMGYGQIWSGGPRALGHMLGAHRVSWELHYGPVPTGLAVLHRCDCTTCVRPTHLFVGTQAENMADKAAKGRAWKPQGSEHPNSKLTAEIVLDIRARGACGTRGVQRVLAAEYGLSQQHISEILRRIVWKHI